MLVRRSALLLSGLTLYGFSLTLLLRADLGLDPWDVFHQGLAETIGWSLGRTIVLTSFAVLALWIPLRERPGLGTIANAVVVGMSVEVFSALIPDAEPLWLRWVVLALGVVGNGVATGMYIGAGMGPGPRDGLMTGIARRHGSIRVVRTSIEVTVLVTGILLGGTFGVGTLVYAVSIGPLAHVFLPIFTRLASPASAAAVPSTRG
ncbi:YczE/YyaS/YitT family protein [Ilumatobacter sp.]|uniref:membrane protein YczE n=1 Tax=Ilumatobacter sp. TaxID=1967498 RepID=UPI003AF5BF98